MNEWGGKLHWIILFLIGGGLMMIFPKYILGWLLPVFRSIFTLIKGEMEEEIPVRSKAPDWARVVAQDHTGEWRWHRTTPLLTNGYWISSSPEFDRAGFTKPHSTLYRDSVIKVADMDKTDWNIFKSK